MSNESNGWTEYRKLVLKELEDLNVEAIESRKDNIKIREEIAALKVKAGVWGMMGGAIPVIIGLIIWIIKSGVG